MPRYRVDLVCLLPLAAASYQSSLWIFHLCFAVRKILRSEEGDVWAPYVATLLCCLTPYPSQLRLTRTPILIVPLQPWPETALAGMKAVLVRAQK